MSGPCSLGHWLLVTDDTSRGRMSGPAAGCLVRHMSGGHDGCPGSWIGDEHDELHGKIATLGQNSDELVDGKGWGGWGKLDPHAATQIHGPNPKKSQLTDKSQKNLGLFLVGIFKIGEEHNKIGLENKEGRLRNRDQPGS